MVKIRIHELIHLLNFQLDDLKFIQFFIQFHLCQNIFIPIFFQLLIVQFHSSMKKACEMIDFRHLFIYFQFFLEIQYRVKCVE